MDSLSKIDFMPQLFDS